MKRAKLSARIVCLGLVLCCLSACTLFRGNGGVAADQAPPTAAPAAAPTAAPPMSAGSEAAGPEQPPAPAEEPETVQELPEIEIPMETAAPEGGTPHASAQPAGETASPALPSPTPVISAAPASSEPEPDNGSTGDIQTYDNGDVMLPEAP